MKSIALRERESERGKKPRASDSEASSFFFLSWWGSFVDQVNAGHQRTQRGKRGRREWQSIQRGKWRHVGGRREVLSAEEHIQPPPPVTLGLSLAPPPEATAKVDSKEQNLLCLP